MPVEEIGDGKKRVTTPLTEDDVRSLAAGDVVVVSGTVLAARDTGHKKMVELIAAGEDLPFDPKGAVLYYVGPTPERPGNVIGAASPTTALRLDPYTPQLLELGVKGLIGKGNRGPEVREALRRNVAVYMSGLGGGGALAARRVKAQRIIAWEEMGTEALREIELEDLPAWVVNDCRGRDHYQESVGPWRKNDELPEELRLGEG